MTARRRKKSAQRSGDPAQASLLGVMALVLGAAGIVLPLPLGLAGVLLGGWAVWRHGKTRLAQIGLYGAAACTAAGIALGAAL